MQSGKWKVESGGGKMNVDGVYVKNDTADLEVLFLLLPPPHSYAYYILHCLGVHSTDSILGVTNDANAIHPVVEATA